MNQLHRKESLVENMAYMGIMAAINVVFVLLTTFVPVLVFLIVFVLPLTSAMVTLFCKKKYFYIYAIATIGLCLVCTIWKIDDTLFYVIPSIFSGFLFGFLVEKKVPSFWIILSTTILQIGFTYLSIPLINLITGRNIIEVFAIAFGISDFPYLAYIVPCFIFFISIVQETFAFIVVKEEINKFGFYLNNSKQYSWTLLILLGSALLLTVILAFTYKELSYMFLLFQIFFSILLLVYLTKEKKIWIYISLIFGLIVSFFLFGIFYQNITKPLGLLLVSIYTLSIGIVGLINNCLSITMKKDKIK